MGACASVNVLKPSIVDSVLNFAVSPDLVFDDHPYEFEFSYTFSAKAKRPQIKTFTDYLNVVCALTRVLFDDKYIRLFVRYLVTLEDGFDGETFEMMFFSHVTVEHCVVMLHVLSCMKPAKFRPGVVESFVISICKMLFESQRRNDNYWVSVLLMDSYVTAYSDKPLSDFSSVKVGYLPNFLSVYWEYSVVAVMVIVVGYRHSLLFGDVVAVLKKFRFLSVDMWNMLFVMLSRSIVSAEDLREAAECFRSRSSINVVEFWGEMMKKSLMCIGDENVRHVVCMFVENNWFWVVYEAHTDAKSSTSSLSCRRYAHVNTFTLEQFSKCVSGEGKNVDWK